MSLSMKSIFMLFVVMAILAMGMASAAGPLDSNRYASDFPICTTSCGQQDLQCPNQCASWQRFTISTSMSKVVSINGSNNLTLVEACALTRFNHLCTRTMIVFHDVSNQSPYTWARRATDLALWNVQSLNRALVEEIGTVVPNLFDFRRIVLDCINATDRTLVNIQNALQLIKNINSGHFEDRMSKVETRLRSAFAAENSCKERLSRDDDVDTRLAALTQRVATSTKMVNNALALNRYLARVGMVGRTKPK